MLGIRSAESPLALLAAQRSSFQSTQRPLFPFFLLQTKKPASPEQFDTIKNVSNRAANVAHSSVAIQEPMRRSQSFGRFRRNNETVFEDHVHVS